MKIFNLNIIFIIFFMFFSCSSGPEYNYIDKAFNSDEAFKSIDITRNYTAGMNIKKLIAMLRIIIEDYGWLPERYDSTLGFMQLNFKDRINENTFTYTVRIYIKETAFNLRVIKYEGPWNIFDYSYRSDQIQNKGLRERELNKKIKIIVEDFTDTMVKEVYKYNSLG